MQQKKTNTAKKIISWIVAAPALVIVASDISDLSLWWVQFAAIGLLIIIMAWNGLFPDIREELSAWKE